MRNETETQGTDLMDEYYELLQDGGESGRILTAAIAEGLAIKLKANDLEFESRHYLIFLFRDGQARNNLDALQRWVKQEVVFRLKCGLDDHDIFDSVGEKFEAAVRNAGWVA